MDIVFSKKADEALVDIYDYIGIENHNPSNAEKDIHKIINGVTPLATSPKLGRALNCTTRFLVIGKYVVVYQIKKHHIFIVSIYTAGKN